MDSFEAQMEDFQADDGCLDSNGGNNVLKVNGNSQDSPSISDMFWHIKANEIDLSSRILKCKPKILSQKCNGTCNLNNQTGYVDSAESKWHDLPMELLMRVLSLVDSRTIIVASGVCVGWRDALRIGVLELSLTWCKKNTSKLVQSIAPKFNRLQACSLSVRNDRHDRFSLNDDAVDALANNCHDLRFLDLSKGTRLTDASLFALAQGCRKLERLNLSGCTGVSQMGIIALAEGCSNLTHLNLCGCVNAGSDQSLLALAKNCSSLQCLNLGWCERISDLGVTGLALWCPDLRLVDLCGCHMISDRSVIALADKCHRLRVLGLYSCRDITDKSMYSLANSSKYRAVKIKKKCNDNCYKTNYAASTGAVTRSSTGSCSTNSNSSSSSCSSSDGNTVTSRDYFDSLMNEQEGYGLVSLNLGMCATLSAPAVQAVCDAFPGLHTCPEKHSLIISGCLNLTSVHCLCGKKDGKTRSAIGQLQGVIMQEAV